MSILFLQQGGATITVATPPPDRDDQDAAGNTLTFTAFTGGDGYEIRAPRFEVMHSVDAGVDSALHGYERIDPDRFTALSSRHGRLPTTASNSLRFVAQTKRAGERFALLHARIVVDVSDPGPSLRSRLSTNTDTHTGGDGYESRVPQWRAFLSTDSGRDVALSIANTDRDRDRVSFSLPRGKSVGWTGRLRLDTDGRAGNRWGLYGIRVIVDVTENNTPKAKEI